MLKAHVCQVTSDLAPKVHNLVRLAQLFNLSFSETQNIFLARFDQYQLEGRYPDKLLQPPKVDQAKEELKQVEELLKWLLDQF